MWKIAPLLTGLWLSANAQEAVFRVSPHDPNGASRALARALADARGAGGSARVVLEDGRYELNEPVLIQEASGYQVHVSAAPNAKPVLSGGRLISGWKQDAKNSALWKTELSLVREGKWNFRQLFVNGKRKTRARTPNSGFFRIDGPSSEEHPMKLRFHPGDIKSEWAVRGDVEVVALLAWSDIRMQIRAVDDALRVATLSGDPRPSNKEANAQYWVENAPEFLDSPGEWYLDDRTGLLSYWAESGEDLHASEVIAPVLEELVVVKGQPDKPVKNIKFSGIEFAHTDWNLSKNGYADTQAAVAVRGIFRAEFARNIAIEDCKFAHLAGYGLELGRGCTRFSIVRNEFVDLGGGGIRIGEPARPRNATEENNHHEITDNELHELGRVYAPAVGILIMQSGGNRIAHNHIHDLYYTAISVGWNWGYQETPCRDNVIEFNHLHDIGKGVLSDMGAIYTLGIQRGTVLRNNVIHDVNALNYGGWGLYTDEGSMDILLESNVVYRCKSAGFHQHYGRENIVRNNIFAFNRENQLMRTRPEAHSSFTFTNNIVAFDSGNLLGSDWSNDHYTIDYNLYFDRRGPIMKFADGTLDRWRERGHDRHSIIADPLFVAPENDDFRLRPESPALKMGFKPIDLSRVGVRPRPTSPSRGSNERN